MKEVCADLTVYFQDPYWIGEYKRIIGEKIKSWKLLGKSKMFPVFYFRKIRK